MKAYGKLDWSIAGGKIPFLTKGKEPEFTSHDKIAVLNTSDEDALIEIVILHEDEEPWGNYNIQVKAKRLRKIRFNDLIDPAAIQMERNYGCYIKSNVPVIIQFSRMNTGANPNAETSAVAFPIED